MKYFACVVASSTLRNHNVTLTLKDLHSTKTQGTFASSEILKAVSVETDLLEFLKPMHCYTIYYQPAYLHAFDQFLYSFPILLRPCKFLQSQKSTHDNEQATNMDRSYG